MALNRGEIWWADLAEPRGSEPGDRRPVLMTLDKSFFEERIGKLPARLMRSIDLGLRLALSLDTTRR